MAWKPDDSGRRAGRVRCGGGFLHLYATAPAAAAQRISLQDVRVLSLAGGVLLLEIDGCPSLRLRSLEGVGTLLELAQQIAAGRHPD